MAQPRNVMKNLRVKDYIKVDSGVQEPYVEYTATATNIVNSGLVSVNHATVPVVISIPAPGSAGKSLIVTDNSASGTAAHVVTFTGSTVNATGNNTATFDAPLEQLILYSVSATEWLIVLNSGSVGLSTV